MNKMLLEFLLKVLPFILANLTPTIKEALWAAVYALEKKADETPNAVDNLLVDALKIILGMPEVQP